MAKVNLRLFVNAAAKPNSFDFIITFFEVQLLLCVEGIRMRYTFQLIIESNIKFLLPKSINILK